MNSKTYDLIYTLGLVNKSVQSPSVYKETPEERRSTVNANTMSYEIYDEITDIDELRLQMEAIRTSNSNTIKKVAVFIAAINIVSLIGTVIMLLA